MTIEISKMSWGVPCKDTWSIDDNYDSFQNTIIIALKNIIEDNDREFLSYNIYLNGEYMSDMYTYLEKIAEKYPYCTIAQYFKTILADECDYSPMFSDEYDTEYSQYRREMQERLFE